MATEQNALYQESERIYDLYKKGKATWQEYVAARDKCLVAQGMVMSA